VTSERRFEAVVDAFARDRKLAPIAAAWRKERASGGARKFGAGALRANGKIFAMLVRERLVVKLARDRVAELVRSGAGEPFDPGHGRVMKEWVVILDEDCSWLELAREAHGFVGGAKRR
jgi:hypothetical protein